MKRINLLALVLTFAVLLVSCSEDPGVPSAVIAPAGPGPQGSFSFDLDDLEYETISGTLQPGQSGGMYAYLTTWPRNCLVSLVVPAESMPGGGPIDFSISVPTQESYLDPAYAAELEGVLIIRLAPDNTQFLGPIYVQATWMPWEGAPPATVWYHNGTDWGIATVTYYPSINRYRVSFEVDHFSDWEVGPEPD